MNDEEMSSQTLQEAKEESRKKAMNGESHPCPLCQQNIKIYHRQIHATLARGLATMYRNGGASDYVHIPSLPGDTHELSQLKWWGLIQEENLRREDGGRAGYYRMTERGRLFVLNRQLLPKYAVVYNGKRISLEGDLVSISDCLGDKFSYKELMTE